MNSIRRILRFLLSLSWHKTVWFNFTYFPFREAVIMPVFIYKHTKLVRMAGTISIEGPIKMGMIRIGHYVLGTQDERYSDTVMEIAGNMVFLGSACIGRGTKMSVGEKANLVVGNELTINGDTEIYCHHQIFIGNSCTFSWDILIMDTDFHAINDKHTNKRLNPPKPICIGNHVWIGCRSTILKGTVLPNNTIVSANSLISKEFSDEHSIIGGNGNSSCILKSNVEWVN